MNQTKDADRDFGSTDCSSSGITVEHHGVVIRVPDDLLDYFAQDPLPCPVVGCDWRGTSLGLHCHQKHAIDADTMRELLGACVGQSLSTQEYGERRSQITKQQEDNKFISGEVRADPRSLPRRKVAVRRQQRQAASKARQTETFRQSLKNRTFDSAKLSENAKQQWDKMDCVIIVCEACGTQHKVKRINATKARFCSTECQKKAYGSRTKKTACQECGADVAQPANTYRKYCDRCLADRRSANAKKQYEESADAEKTCEWCGVQFVAKGAVASVQRFCSSQCQAKQYRKKNKPRMDPEEVSRVRREAVAKIEKVDKSCEHCGSTFSVRLSNASTAKFCGSKCAAKARWERKKAARSV